MPENASGCSTAGPVESEEEMTEAEVWTSQDQVHDDSISITHCNDCDVGFTFRTNEGAGEVECPNCGMAYVYDMSKEHGGFEPK